jgi:hypothetical protein
MSTVKQAAWLSAPNKTAAQVAETNTSTPSDHEIRAGASWPKAA